MSLSHLTGQPIDCHRHRVTGVVDKQLVAGRVALGIRPAWIALKRVGLKVKLRS